MTITMVMICHNSMNIPAEGERSSSACAVLVEAWRRNIRYRMMEKKADLKIINSYSSIGALALA